LYTESHFVCNVILGYCLSPQILAETNINVQIRNSWTLSFICSLYPLQDFITSTMARSKPPGALDIPYQNNLEICIAACIKYA